VEEKPNQAVMVTLDAARLDAPHRSHETREEQVALRPSAHGRWKLVTRALVCSDVVALLLAYVVAELIAGDDLGKAVGLQLLAFVTTLPLWTLGAKLYGLYDRDVRRADHSTVEDLVPAFHLITVGVWFGVVGGWLVGRHWQMSAIAAFWVTALAMFVVARAITRSIVRTRGAFVQNAIIVGAGDVGQLVGRKIQHHPELGIRLVGFVDGDPKTMRADLDGVPLLGTPAQIVEIVKDRGVERVIVSFSNDRHDDLLELVRALRGLDVHIDVVPRLFEAVGPAVGLHTVEGLPLVELPPVRVSQWSRATKRAIDLVGAAVLLALLSPLLVWITWRVRRGSHGPALFRQTRLGNDMREFTLLKFRTMVADADEAPHRAYVREIMDTGAAPNGSKLYKLERADEVTKVGAWLRRTSLDELPQLINVVRGEMSLVGPRPCIPYETEVFEPHHFDRFLVPAGMTGLWQVTGRANTTLKEALDLDAAYARNWSLRLDLWLLARTPSVVLRGRKATT
jgi:exopolysaccharide biosynthesis polyprenyl glycosylphosphotransferase